LVPIYRNSRDQRRQDHGCLLFNVMGRKISALKVQKRNPRRVNVYLEGEFAFGLERTAAAWLKIGQDLSEEKIAQLQSEDEGEKAYLQALKLLSYRPRSESEVRKKLKQRSVPESMIAEVLERLHRSGLIDDARFARDWAENRSEFRPRSRRALAIEMRQRGVDNDAITQAVASLDDESLAYQAAVKYCRRLNGLEWQVFRQKLTGFLARRGFNYEIAAPVVKRVWDENRTDKIEEEKL
jgi:regulatory protein